MLDALYPLAAHIQVVGDVESIDTDVIDLLLSRSFIPVIMPMVEAVSLAHDGPPAPWSFPDAGRYLELLEAAGFTVTTPGEAHLCCGSAGAHGCERAAA